MLDKPTRRYQYMMFMAQRNQFSQSPSRHQTEGPACELQGIDIAPHRFENVFKVPFAERRVVRTSYLRYPVCPRFHAAVVGSQERKRSFVLFRLCQNGHHCSFFWYDNFGSRCFVRRPPALSRSRIRSRTGINSRFLTASAIERREYTVV